MGSNVEKRSFLVISGRTPLLLITSRKAWGNNGRKLVSRSTERTIQLLHLKRLPTSCPKVISRLLFLIISFIILVKTCFVSMIPNWLLKAPSGVKSDDRKVVRRPEPWRRVLYGLGVNGLTKNGFQSSTNFPNTSSTPLRHCNLY